MHLDISNSFLKLILIKNSNQLSGSLVSYLIPRKIFTIFPQFLTKILLDFLDFFSKLNLINNSNQLSGSLVSYLNPRKFFTFISTTVTIFAKLSV